MNVAPCTTGKGVKCVAICCGCAGKVVVDLRQAAIILAGLETVLERAYKHADNLVCLKCGKSCPCTECLAEYDPCRSVRCCHCYGILAPVGKVEP